MTGYRREGVGRNDSKKMRKGIEIDGLVDYHSYLHLCKVEG